MVGFAFQGFMGENVVASGPAEVLSRNLLQRVKDTSLWVLDITESLESVQPGGAGFEATVRVRLLHAWVRKGMQDIMRTRPSYFNEAANGVPINTYDSVLRISFFYCNPI